jgi:cystathionine beta-lyase
LKGSLKRQRRKFMAEKNLDFDTVIERRHTNSLKYDFARRRGKPENVLPFWVADMDFKISSYIQEALHKQVEHGIYGYSEVQEEYFEVVKAWMKDHYNWDVDIRWLIKTPGIVFALAMAIKAFTNKGDGVLIQQPVYYPFSEVIVDNERKIVDNTLVIDEAGKYHIDFEDFENKIKKEGIKLFFLCNPQNPSGRVFTKEELIKMGDICLKYDVIVVSDEIHADFVFKGQHNVFANLKEEYKDISIVCTSPSKTFNLAGTQISNIFIPNRQIKHQFRKQIAAAGYSQLNAVGLVACEAAYKYGEEWYQAVYVYIRDNIAYTRNYIKRNIPEIKMIEPEGTYLVWLDFRGLGLSDKAIDDLVINKAGLWLDSGAIFGASGEGFQRINVACPRASLTNALERLERAVHNR